MSEQLRWSCRLWGRRYLWSFMRMKLISSVASTLGSSSTQTLIRSRFKCLNSCHILMSLFWMFSGNSYSLRSRLKFLSRINCSTPVSKSNRRRGLLSLSLHHCQNGSREGSKSCRRSNWSHPQISLSIGSSRTRHSIRLWQKICKNFTNQKQQHC